MREKNVRYDEKLSYQNGRTDGDIRPTWRKLSPLFFSTGTGGLLKGLPDPGLALVPDGDEFPGATAPEDPEIPPPACPLRTGWPS